MIKLIVEIEVVDDRARVDIRPEAKDANEKEDALTNIIRDGIDDALQEPWKLRERELKLTIRALKAENRDYRRRVDAALAQVQELVLATEALKYGS